MHPRSLFLAVPALLLLAQDPDRPPAAPEGLVGMPMARAKLNAKLAEDLQGAWRLRQVDHPAGVIGSGDVNGIALFVDGYVSITLHAVARDPAGIEPVQFYYQAGTHQFELRGAGELVSAAMLGHGNFGGGFLPEPANNPRELSVDIAGDELTLTHTDGVQLRFERMPHGSFPAAAEELLHKKRVRELEWGDFFGADRRKITGYR